jgi:hypothetical protein
MFVHLMHGSTLKLVQRVHTDMYQASPANRMQLAPNGAGKCGNRVHR